MEKSIHTRAYDAFCRLLRRARRDAGLTQVALAAALGQSQSFVSKVERGETRLDVIQLRTVLAALKVTLPEFARRLERELGSRGSP
jgi:transcriptional regulator with XRE-family HTH domain